MCVPNFKLFLNLKSLVLWSFSIIFAVLLSACGGGGGDGDGGGDDEDTLVVDSTTPSNGETVESFPTEISIEFNRDVLLSSVSAAQFILTASGGDGSFGDGNESDIAIDDASATGSDVSVDVTTAAATADDDTYQLTIVSEDVSAISDNDGALLDGDADDVEGGNYIGTFVVETPPPPPEPTLTDIQSSIFTPTCATSGCHDPDTAPQGLVLIDGQAFSNIVNVTANQNNAFNRIEPGDPDNSYLVQKIEGTASAGQQMPRNQPPLSSDEIQLIRDWVTAGALDN